MSSDQVDNRHVNVDYQVAVGSLPYHRAVADLVIKHSSDGDHILDIGTGAGSVPYIVQQKGRRSVDIADAYQACLKTASSRVTVTQSFLIDEEQFDIAAKIPPARYAVVTMSHVLEHLLNPVQGVRDAMSLVKPGGHLILAVPNPVRPLVFINALLRRKYSNPGHVAAWDRSHWINFLENVLEVHVVEYGGDYVQLLPRSLPVVSRLEQWLVRLFPWLTFSNIAVIKVDDAGDSPSVPAFNMPHGPNG